MMKFKHFCVYSQSSNEDVMKDLRKVCEIWNLSEVHILKVLRISVNTEWGIDFLTESVKISVGNMDPVIWWESYQSMTPDLITSASACETNVKQM